MGRGKRRDASRATAAPQRLPAVELAVEGLAASGPRVFRQSLAETPAAGYDLERTWAKKVQVEPEMVDLVTQLRAAFPQFAERLPVAAADGSHLYFTNEKARWFYSNQPDELRWEHEAASECVLSPEFDCFVHSTERDDVQCDWFRYPGGEQVYREGIGEEAVQLLEIEPSGNVHTADGWLRLRTPAGLPKPSADGVTDIHASGRRECRAAVFKKPERLPYELYPLHREDGPAVIAADGTVEHWRRGKQVKV
jgi:hypothetical protein